ncbi:hypothetical protein Q3G72_024461 [Acer saccharum]|nr:hypothetical protein Q3G72_024461 [Acer saccharum]
MHKCQVKEVAYKELGKRDAKCRSSSHSIKTLLGLVFCFAGFLAAAVSTLQFWSRVDHLLFPRHPEFRSG